VKTGICERQETGNFAENGDFHAIVGIFNMPKILDIGPTDLLPPEGRHTDGPYPEKSNGSGRVRVRDLGYQRLAR
jgi:hypothetical protein